MSDVETFVLAVVERTDGWVLLAIVGMYFAYRTIMKVQENLALRKSLALLNDVIAEGIRSINQNILKLIEKMD